MSIRRKRALSSEEARRVRQQGHNDALQFALELGLTRDYENDRQAKKDVIDPSGDAHSLKSGLKKWQIFLYRRERFINDSAFILMNGIGALLVECIDAFPESFEAYVLDKTAAKMKLQDPMTRLAERLRAPGRLKGFILKAIFNGGEVNYLTVKHQGKFHVFHNTDVANVFGEFEVCNSLARKEGDIPNQKVLLRWNGVNVGEIEMRNDSAIHYREIRFNMIKPRAMELLFSKIPHKSSFSPMVEVYGAADKRFGRWRVKR